MQHRGGLLNMQHRAQALIGGCGAGRGTKVVRTSVCKLMLWPPGVHKEQPEAGMSLFQLSPW